MLGIENKITKILKEELKFPSSEDIQQRGIADKIESACNKIIIKNFDNVSPATSRKSIEDISIGDIYVDHKSSDVALEFKMPNMISIDRLKNLTNSLIYNFVIYDSNKREIIDTFAINVYELNWEHLSIQNIGKGQLQIKNMNKFLESPRTQLTKSEWLRRLSEETIKFYEKLIKKTEKNILEWKKFNDTL
jgi:hypothetical protein